MYEKDNSVEDGGSRSIDSSMRGLFASQHTGWSFKMFPGSAFGEYFGGGFIGTVLRSGNGVCHISDKVLMGTGTLLAFPGSMCGALLCGLVYKYSKNIPLTCIGELFGTSVLGGICAYPIAALLMGKEAVLWTYILPFFVSSAGGTVIAAVILFALKKTKVLNKMGQI